MKLALQSISVSQTEDIGLFPNWSKVLFKAKCHGQNNIYNKLSVKLALQCISELQTKDIGLFPNWAKVIYSVPSAMAKTN